MECEKHCRYSFKRLSSTILPEKMKELSKSKKIRIRTLFSNGTGVKGALKKLNLTQDVKGVYVFFQNNKPVYVGISRHIIKRLRNHIKGRNHHQATLAYLITKEKNNYLGKRKGLSLDFGKNEINSMSVSFIEILCPIERYLFEVYSSIELKTKWNGFETH